MISTEEFSVLVGRIYDCAIEPDRWPNAMGEICRAVRCAAAAILLIDLQTSQHQFFRTCNLAPHWVAAQEQYFDELTLVYRNSQAVAAGLLDTPTILSRDVPEEIYANTRMFREWARPQGFCDSCQVVVLQTPQRVGAFALQRHEDVGPITDADIAVLRLLAPHVRRAVTISDVMDLKSLERAALTATLDAIAAGVIVVAGDRRIVHANRSAERMFAAGEPVRSRHGRLAAPDATADGILAEVISLAQENEPELGAAGIGVPLAGPSAEPAIAHVLPLAGGELRPRLVARAAAAIFVKQASAPVVLDVVAIASALGLTGAEARLLRQLVSGATLAVAAAALGIATTTARTHLSHIFTKAGVSRLADLIALVHRLAPPAQGRNDD